MATQRKLLIGWRRVDSISLGNYVKTGQTIAWWVKYRFFSLLFNGKREAGDASRSGEVEEIVMRSDVG